MFFEGYVAFEREEFQDYFFANCAQLAMKKGDAVFFNPAVMHGAGTNRTADLLRLVNLLQVSSPMGRTMEAIDRSAMVKDLYPVLMKGQWSPDACARIVAASAEGYAFPTNLDTDPAVGGMSPATQADLMKDALIEDMEPEKFVALIDSLDERRLP
jgi:ectoine hydroxylase-related dioxygenase (phytanoyl-CoA dioxygenase family)